ncbi:hypothetical protein BJ508DRAFT_364112 [Ascobolus immersus RN42]|uniref:Uncharacterized protein n=1 Tax=Ascobolus immersus RN42 TaxID=1160509 RepID=A0A3N4HVQ7_ASCIM|nr:hypothetical protein BJ508DRAFT_364112 [Ascobolus immersus RN42]
MPRLPPGVGKSFHALLESDKLSNSEGHFGIGKLFQFAMREDFAEFVEDMEFGDGETCLYYMLTSPGHRDPPDSSLGRGAGVEIPVESWMVYYWVVYWVVYWVESLRVGGVHTHDDGRFTMYHRK